MSERWWRRRRKSEWVDFFDEVDRLEEMIERVFETPPKRARFRKPHVYGFSMSVGPDAKPEIRELGDGNLSRGGTKDSEERELLVDVVEENTVVVVVAELPGTQKDNINLHATKDHLTISVNTSEIKYHKELILPAMVNPKSARASYKNGVLEVRLKKLVEFAARDERISVE